MTTAKFRAIQARKSRRYAEAGRKQEVAVQIYLEEMIERGEIESFQYHKPNSLEDSTGRDFTVSKKTNGNVVTEKSFGMTISLKCWHRAKTIHPDVPQLCFPLGMDKRKVIQKILDLFDEPLQIQEA